METPKTLRRPSNWQDFESLCKKLWGEVWNCPEIKKNGRTGQAQHGVDIYGIPNNETEYYGIQCKGKDEYQNKELTEKEISEEIEKAKVFSPPLKKIYFATTAVKDAVIEEFVRKKNIENKTNGLFEVHLYSWEDIVDLIDENKQTHDWYINNQKYKTQKSILVSFHDGTTNLLCKPKFRKIVKEYKQKIVTSNPYLDPLSYFTDQIDQDRQVICPISHMRNPKNNLSFFKLGINVLNTGSAILEDFQIILDFDGKVSDIDYTNKIGGFSHIQSAFSHLNISKESMEVKIHPKDERLVSDALFCSEYFYVKPFLEQISLKLKWKFLSKDYKCNGELSIGLGTTIVTEYKTVLVTDPLKKGTEEGPVEDFLVDD